MTLDLHGYSVHVAWKMFNQYMSGCYYNGIKKTIVITGYGSIQQELPQWCSVNEYVKDCIQHNPNLGSFTVYLKKSKPRLSIVKNNKNIVDLSPLEKKFSKN